MIQFTLMYPPFLTSMLASKGLCSYIWKVSLKKHSSALRGLHTTQALSLYIWQSSWHHWPLSQRSIPNSLIISQTPHLNWIHHISHSQRGHINWDEGSERWSRSLVCSSGIGVNDARMTVIYRVRELGWYEVLFRADECFLVKLSRCMSIVL